MKKIALLWLLAIGTLFASPPSISDQSFTIEENLDSAYLVGTVAASGQNLTFYITEGNFFNAFSLDSLSGQLRVKTKQAIDYELYKSFKLKVKVSNTEGIDSAFVTVNLINLNDNKPRIFDSLLIFVKENTPKDTLLHQVFAFDADGDLNPLVYSLLSPLPDLNKDSIPSIKIDTLSGKIYVNDEDEFDYERFRLIRFTVRVSDGKFSDTASYNIELVNINDNKPVIFADTIRVHENLSFDSMFYRVRSFDADFPLDTLYFGILENADPNENSLNAVYLDVQSGELFVKDSLDFDYELATSFKLKIWVSDTLFFDTATFVVQIIDLNDTPPVFSSDTVEIDENLPKDSLVAKLKIYDPDTNNKFSYRIVSGNRFDAFYIDSLGNIRVQTDSAIDYETTTDFALVIEVSDGVFKTQGSVRILLRNLNDNPPISENPTFTIPENYPNGLLVGLLRSSDADQDTLTFRIVGGNIGNAFRLENSSLFNSCRIVVENSLALDYEKNPVFTVLIEANDGMFKDTAQVTVRLINLNDEPIVLFDTLFLTPEDQPNLIVGRVRYHDPDNLGLPEFSFIDTNYNDSLTVGVLGEIRAKNRQVINYEYRSRFSFYLQVFDGFFYDTALIQVVLLDRNDPPTGIKLSDTVLFDRTPAGKTVATLQAIDEDRFDSHTFTIVIDTTTDERFFFIRNGNQLAINRSININEKRTYSFDMVVTDKAGASHRQTIRLGVDLANSLPEQIYGLTIYPNPSRDRVFVRMENDLLGEIHWQIIDLQGKNIREGSLYKSGFYLDEPLDLQTTGPGMYLLKIAIENQAVSLKIRLE